MVNDSSGRMIFEFAPAEKFNFVAAFARWIGTTVYNNVLILPPTLGEGSIRPVRLTPDFSLLIHQYTLSEELILRRTAADNTADQVNVLFQLNAGMEKPPAFEDPARTERRTEYIVHITSPDVSSELRFPSDIPVFLAVLSMSRPALANLLHIRQMNRVVEQILVGSGGFLFYETMSAEAQHRLRTLAAEDTQRELSGLRIWIQVQELLCWLFERLLTRDIIKHRPVHRADAEQLSRVRATVVADLSVPPQLPELADLAGMSVSKLTDLYKQVFGDSIYDYFQKARMDEAGHLLKQASMSVSEVGHQLGFSNLSHFSRLFEKHYGSTPKRFATRYINSLSQPKINKNG